LENGACFCGFRGGVDGFGFGNAVVAEFAFGAGVGAGVGGGVAQEGGEGGVGAGEFGIGVPSAEAFGAGGGEILGAGIGVEGVGLLAHGFREGGGFHLDGALAEPFGLGHAVDEVELVGVAGEEALGEGEAEVFKGGGGFVAECDAGVAGLGCWIVMGR
jgi:hypothetical protein